jgi:hypothetical protein
VHETDEPDFIGDLRPKKAERLAKGMPLSVRIAKGNPKSLKTLSNTVNANISWVVPRASQHSRYRLVVSVIVSG